MRAEGLLEQIAETALDDDYYVVRAGNYAESREFNTPLTGLVLAAFALLVVIAAVQTRNDRPATERERDSLISDVAARKKVQASREATAERLRKEVADLSASVGQFDPAYQNVRIETGDLAVTGSGITDRRRRQHAAQHRRRHHRQRPPDPGQRALVRRRRGRGDQRPAHRDPDRASTSPTVRSTSTSPTSRRPTRSWRSARATHCCNASRTTRPVATGHPGKRTHPCSSA